MQAYYETHHRDFRVTSHRPPKAGRLACHAHLHQQVELVYMRHGEAIAVLDSKRYVLDDDSLFLSLPNCIHAYESHDKEDFQLMIVNPDRIPGFEALVGGRFPREPVFRHVSSHPELVGLLEVIEGEIGKEPDKKRDAVLSGCFLALMGLLLRLMPIESAGEADSDMMRRIVDYCVANCAEELSLEVLADELHISKYYISHLFGKRFPMSFKDYINSLRLSHACRLLETSDMTITEIGSRVGFGSSRTFNRAFRKHYSLSPGEYRAALREGTLDGMYAHEADIWQKTGLR